MKIVLFALLGLVIGAIVGAFVGLSLGLTWMQFFDLGCTDIDAACFTIAYLGFALGGVLLGAIVGAVWFAVLAAGKSARHVRGAR
jgi:hypothetical protein